MTESVERAPDTRVWTDVAAVLTVVVTLVIAARQLRPLAENGAFLARTGEAMASMPNATWPRAVLWVAVAAAVLLRWRAVTLVAVWVAVGYEVVIALLNLNGEPAYAMPAQYLLGPGLLALTVAVLASVPAPVGRGLNLLGRRGTGLLIGAAAVITLSAMVIPFTATYYGSPPPDAVDPGSYIAVERRADLVNALAFGTQAVGLTLIVAALTGVVGPVRRRALSLIAATATGFAVAQFVVAAQLNASLYGDDPTPLPTQPGLVMRMWEIPYGGYPPPLPPVLLGFIGLTSALVLGVGLMGTYLSERADRRGQVLP